MARVVKSVRIEEKLVQLTVEYCGIINDIFAKEIGNTSLGDMINVALVRYMESTCRHMHSDLGGRRIGKMRKHGFEPYVVDDKIIDRLEKLSEEFEQLEARMEYEDLVKRGADV